MKYCVTKKAVKKQLDLCMLVLCKYLKRLKFDIISIMKSGAKGTLPQLLCNCGTLRRKKFLESFAQSVGDFLMYENLIKSKKRVQQHGEVFTPKWMIDLMLDIPGIKHKLEKQEDIDTTFLEPSAGEGFFLVEILKRKLSAIHARDKSWETFALRALASIYAIELLEDNLYIAKQSMFEVVLNERERIFGKRATKSTNFYKAAEFIIEKNIVQGNTLERLNNNGNEIKFSEWKRVKNHPKLVERIPFSYSSLFEEENPQLDLFEVAGQMDLFEEFEEKEIGQSKKYKIVEIDQVWKEEME